MIRSRPIKMRFNLRELMDICFCLEQQGIFDPKYLEGVRHRNLLRRLNRVEMYHLRKEAKINNERERNMFAEQDRTAVARHPHFSDNDGHRVDYTYGVKDGIMAHCKDCRIEIKVS